MQRTITKAETLTDWEADTQLPENTNDQKKATNKKHSSTL